MTHAQKHTHLQTAPTPPADQSLQKSVFLPTKREFYFFLLPFGVLIFLQRTTDT